MIKSNFKEIDVLKNEEPDYFKFAHQASLICLEIAQRGKRMSKEDAIEKIEREDKAMRNALNRVRRDTNGNIILEDNTFEKGYLAGLNYCLSILRGL